MGEVDVGLIPDGTFGNVYLQIGWHGITYVGGGEGETTVSFGVGDAALADNDVGSITGVPEASIGTWVLADMNCDGLVNFDDIDGFVAALASRWGYYETYPHCRWMNGDCDGSGTVNFDDIDRFVECLANQGCP
jgi:hypothetical protein